MVRPWLAQRLVLSGLFDDHRPIWLTIFAQARRNAGIHCHHDANLGLWLPNIQIQGPDYPLQSRDWRSGAAAHEDDWLQPALTLYTPSWSSVRIVNIYVCKNVAWRWACQALNEIGNARHAQLNFMRNDSPFQATLTSIYKVRLRRRQLNAQLPIAIDQVEIPQVCNALFF